MQKVVIDTNVLVSAMLSANSNPAKIIKLIVEGNLSVYYNSKILFEYNDVLYRPEFNFAINKIQSIVNTIIEMGVELTPAQSTIKMIDEDDRIFYDLHKAAGAILITGNTKHFPKEDSIMKPAFFMEYILT